MYQWQPSVNTCTGKLRLRKNRKLKSDALWEGVLAAGGGEKEGESEGIGLKEEEVKERR